MRVKNTKISGFFIIIAVLSSSIGYSQELTLATTVEQIMRGFDPDVTIGMNIDDPENVIPTIPSEILNEVSRYLKGIRVFNIESTITNDNYRDYLNAAKFLDLLPNDGYQNSTYPIRLACLLKSGGKIKTLEAFCYRLHSIFFDEVDENGVYHFDKKFELYHAGQFELTFIPEWLQIQKEITRQVVNTILDFSDKLAYENPHLILFTGTYGSGKSYQIYHHRLTENIQFDFDVPFNGVLSTDAIKRLYRTLVPGTTNEQVHHEGVAMRLQIMQGLFHYFSDLSLIQEGAFKENDVQELLNLASKTSSKIKIVDVDADLETACLRILTRDPGKDPVPHFRATVSTYVAVRSARNFIHEAVHSNEGIVEYELIFSEAGKAYLIAKKEEGELQVMPGHEERFLRALSPISEAFIETVAQKIVSEEDCLAYGDQLKRFVGMTIEEALLKFSQE